MGGRGSSSGRRSAAGRTVSAGGIDREIARIQRRAAGDAIQGLNRSDLNLSGNDNILLRQVRSARISSLSPTRVRFKGSNHDWHLEGRESISVSTTTTKYTISKPSEWSSKYILTERRGINNEVAVASSKNVDTLIKRVQKKLR